MNFINESKIGPMYLARNKTDTLFEAPIGSFDYDCEYDRAAKFVESHQSKNIALWSSFVEQFKIQVDANDGGWSGEFYGKMMRGACWIYKYTEDKELYRILEETVRYLLSCREPSGRISSYARDKEFSYWDMWCRKYVLLGTQYFYEICKSEELKAEIIEVLNKHLDYIIDHIGDGEGKIDILESTTHNPFTWGALNSSSILEPVVRQYYLTGNRKYLDFAKYLVDRGGSKWGNIYTLALEGKKAPFEYPVTKAYEATSYFEGVLEYYRATGDEDAKRAFINFIAKVVETDFTIIGCAGTLHELFDNSSLMQTEINDEVKQETCVTVTLMKAFYQALCLTGEAKYADAMERAGYNAMLGSINFNKNTAVATDEEWSKTCGYAEVNPFTRLIEGYTFDSYAPLYKDKRNRRVGGFRRMPGDKSYGCCACIGASGVAIMPLSSVMLSRDGLRINHLMNGSFKLGNVELTVKTAYPYGETATIKVNTDIPESFAIGIRVPEYAKGDMTVNGKPAVADEYGYSIIEKVWHKGDEISLVIPKRLIATELNGKIALTNGIIVLALDERNQDIDIKITSGIVSAKRVETEFFSREAYEVTFDNGVKAIFTDFTSAGQDWASSKPNITVWVDKA
jgi:DUF1680 family protein